MPAEDKERIASYTVYEQIYWSSEEGFEEVMRGDNEQPVFMPTARTLVDTVNRYTAPGFGWTLRPKEGVGDDAVAIVRMAFENLFARERFASKFNTGKRKGITKGDWIWHVIGDDTKEAGRRIKLTLVDPAAYFPVTDESDPDKIVRVHLAETITINGQEKVSRLTYTREFNEAGVQTGITVSHGIFKMEDWFTSATPEMWVIPEKPLLDGIPAIPVYHIPNIEDGPFGSSEMRGLESVLLGINQTMSDEDMALALDGIGIYATDSGAPVDDAGNEVDWIMGPGRVLTNAGGLKRVNGVSSTAPFGEHYSRLLEAVRMAVGASDAAVGKVDSATAESGIALALQLAPILAHTATKDQTIIDVHRQLFYDLCFWLQVYEELPMLIGNPDGDGDVPAVDVIPTIGQKIPSNIKEILGYVEAMRSTVPPIMSVATAHEWLRAAGVPLAEDELTRLETEAAGFLGNPNGEQDDEDEDARRDNELEDADV